MFYRQYSVYFKPDHCWSPNHKNYPTFNLTLIREKHYFLTLNVFVIVPYWHHKLKSLESKTLSENFLIVIYIYSSLELKICMGLVYKQWESYFSFHLSYTALIWLRRKIAVTSNMLRWNPCYSWLNCIICSSIIYLFQVYKVQE